MNTGSKYWLKWSEWNCHHLQAIVKLQIFISIVTVIFDIAPFEYCSDWIAAFFDYEAGSVIAISVVIWTFSATLLVFYLGKKEERHFGIRFSDVLLCTYSPRELLTMVSIFLGEILLLLISALANWEITLAALSLQLFSAMVYILFWVCIETSEGVLLYKIRKQRKGMLQSPSGKSGSDDYKNWLIHKMIRNLNYPSIDETNTLCELLKEEMDPLPDRQTQILIACSLTESILLSGGFSENCTVLLKSWFTDKRTTLETKKGILLTLAERTSPDYWQLSHELLRIEQFHQRELLIWCLTLNAHIQQHANEHWRTLYTRVLKKIFTLNWTSDDWVLCRNYYDEYRSLRNIDSPVTIGIIFRAVFLDT